MIPPTSARKSRHEISAAIDQRTRIRIGRAVSRARLTLLWEALWPRLMPLIMLFSVFLSISWFGLWRITPDLVRMLVLGIFGVAALILVFRAVRVDIPDRAAALARVEQASGSTHRPATAYSDQLVQASDDPATKTLWNAHRRRLLAALTRLRAGTPAPRLAAHDPYAIRFLLALVCIVAFLHAGPERIERVGEALRGGETIAVTLARIDAWVTPPGYTNRPPVFLTGDAARPSGTVYTVPEGSVVTVRIGGNRDLNVVSSGPDGELLAESDGETGQESIGDADTPNEHRLILGQANSVKIRRGEREVMSWNFAIEPDIPPTIALANPPEPTAGGALALAYTIEDDYGVVAAEADISPLGATASAPETRPLVEAPGFPLSLPQLRARSGSSQTVRDLTSHPWAGAKVLLTLIARDDVGQEGKSVPTEIELPSRRFSNPLARAVVEQRTQLALDANAINRVSEGLDALTFAGEDAIEDVTAYLALRSAYYRLINARDDDALREIVDYLWDIAIGIENGNLSLAALALRDAQEALREALENDASDEEIARLTQELREAMHSFLQALADEARQNPQFSTLPPDALTEFFNSQDLDQMLDRIEDLARGGARDTASQLLNELQSLLNSLQAGQQMMADPQANEMMQSLDELGEMIRRQQQLMDETFRADQGLGAMTDEELADALGQLQQDQRSLQQSLEELMAELEGMGMEPNGKLGQAGEAMGDAEEALGEGRPGSAVTDQSAALDALRQGAQGLAEQLASQMQGQNPSGVFGAGNLPNQDPLGRSQRRTGPDFGSRVEVPDEIDIQRAREILEAIRRRLSQPTRPTIEREYLERLLDRF